MDNFSEQLVLKQPASSDKIKKTVMLAAGVLFTVVLAAVSLLNIGSIVSMVGLFAAAAAGYGTYYLVQGMYVEYEYTFTNGELDIDKIVAKRKRTPLVTAEVKKFTGFGKYSDELQESSDMTVVISSDNIASHEYYADFEHEEYGKTRLIFSPDERMLENIYKTLPRNLRNQH